MNHTIPFLDKVFDRSLVSFIWKWRVKNLRSCTIKFSFYSFSITCPNKTLVNKSGVQHEKNFITNIADI